MEQSNRVFHCWRGNCSGRDLYSVPETKTLRTVFCFRRGNTRDSFHPCAVGTLFVTPNFAHGPFPLLLLVLYCLAWTAGKSTVRYPLILFVNFVTIYTGFGFFLGVLTPILLALDYWTSTPQARLPRKYFVAAVLLALASLGSFFLGYRFNADLDCFSLRPQSPASYLAFISLMFANFFSIR